MFIAKIKRFLGFGLSLALALGISTNYLWAAEAAGGGGGHDAGGGAGDVNRYAALTQAEKDTELLQAALYGHLAEVRLLLANGADVNLQRPDGDSVLISAVRNNHVEVVQLLLAAGADANAQSLNGFSALTWATHYGNVEIARLLLGAGADVNAQDSFSCSALIWAAILCRVEVVRLLLANGANVNLQARNGATALMMAAQNGHLEIVQLLLAAGAELPAAGRLSVEQNAMIQTALAELVARKAEFLAAAATGNIAQINRLIALPIRDRKLVMNQALLALAGSETDISAADFERILAILLAHDADIEFRDTVEAGGFREAKGAAAASISAASDTALELAIMTNVPNRVDALLMAGANPEKLSESIRVYLANASLVADLAIKEIAKMIENANMARAMLISPAIFKRFTLNIGPDQDNTLDPVLRYLFQWEEQENDRAKRAGRVRMLATPLPPDED